MMFFCMIHFTPFQVGADGAQSNVRQLAGMDSIGWKYDQSAVVAKLDISDVSRINA